MKNDAVLTPRLALALGKFDALHIGHRALIERAATMGDPALVTFTGMAAQLQWSERQPLVAVSDRNRVLAEWALAIGKPIRLIEIPFAAVQPMTPAQFVQSLFVQQNMVALVVGEDFRFGRGRSGGVAELKQLASSHDVAVAVVPPVLSGNAPVSSSRVRAELIEGDVIMAARLLGRAHRLVGMVVRGDGRGRTLGIPTANCGARQNQEPATGVYAGWALVGDERIPAAINVGHIPTVGGQRPLTVEAHLIHWHGDIYDKPIALDFVERVRDERRFPDLPALVERIHQDIREVQHILEIV